MDEKNLNQYEVIDELVDLFVIADALTKREKEVIYLYFYEYMTESEIAEMLGISQQRVNRIKKKAIKKLKEYAGF